jgi:hypothetical protein
MRLNGPHQKKVLDDVSVPYNELKKQQEAFDKKKITQLYYTSWGFSEQ